jgi:rhodanese-related sulfurtransferase/polyisoprenoid-binding protein YceI
MKTIPIEEAAAFDGPLMDVRLADDFAAGHVPCALNNCVFEVAFAERLAELAVDKDGALCVYGASAQSREAAMAAEKLERSGYTNVAVFDGGMAAWRDAGRDLEGDGELPLVSPPADGRHQVDLSESRLLWVGRNLLNRHWGTVGLSDSWIEVRDSELVGGEFAIDMNAIDCSDLEDNSGRGVLIAHLQSDDFFDSERYPQADYRISSAKRIDGAMMGGPNLHVEGELTLKGVTLPLAFDAVAGITDDGKLAAQATLSLDRTLWGVIYGSGKLFQRLAGHLVNDLIELQLKIVAG